VNVCVCVRACVVCACVCMCGLCSNVYNCVALLCVEQPWTRVVQFEVQPKVWVRKLPRILTNLKSAVRSSVKVWRTFKSSSNFTACVCQNCKGQQPPPSSVPLVTCSKSNMINELCMKYDLYSVSGQEVSLAWRPNLSHTSELLRICTMRHLHCTWRNMYN